MNRKMNPVPSRNAAQIEEARPELSEQAIDAFHGARRCLFKDANLAVPPDLQGNLFEEG